MSIALLKNKKKDTQSSVMALATPEESGQRVFNMHMAVPTAGYDTLIKSSPNFHSHDLTVFRSYNDKERFSGVRAYETAVSLRKIASDTVEGMFEDCREQEFRPVPFFVIMDLVRQYGSYIEPGTTLIGFERDIYKKGIIMLPAIYLEPSGDGYDYLVHMMQGGAASKPTRRQLKNSSYVVVAA